MPSKPFPVRLSPELSEAVKKKADQIRCNKSETLRRAVVVGLPRLKRGKPEI